MLDSYREAGRLMGSELGLDDIFETDQHYLDIEVAGGGHRAFNSGFGGEITAHRVERDSHGLLLAAPIRWLRKADGRDRCRNDGIRDEAVQVRRIGRRLRDLPLAARRGRGADFSLNERCVVLVLALKIFLVN
jgi:hypothetical protein